MRERWQWWVLAAVLAAHAAATWWLARAMQPVPLAAPASVLMVEFFDPPPLPRPEPEPDAEPVEAAAQEVPDRAPDPEPRRRQRPTQPRTPREPSSMQAVIVPAQPAPPEPARERVDAARDPFHRPAQPQVRGFGRRDIAGLRSPARPRLPGEPVPHAPLQGLRHGRIGAREVVDTVAALIGGGRNAPVEAPCGNRLSGGFGTADSFSPNWQQQYGCGDEKQRAGFDGHVELPPGVAGAGE
jgi:hypothetical protein